MSGDTLTAPSVQFTLNANGGQGGAGGLGGNAGPAPGLNGVAGSDGAGSITFTNNVITVGSGIPGDTPTSGSDLLLLNLRVATIGPAGFFLPGTLNGGVGGNLAFSGNTFIGDGASRLVLQLGSTGTATVDTASNTMSIDGSPTSNTISGFTTFDLDTNDTFIAGGGSYRVTFAPDPDTLVMTPTSGNVTLLGITVDEFPARLQGLRPVIRRGGARGRHQYEHRQHRHHAQPDQRDHAAGLHRRHRVWRRDLRAAYRGQSCSDCDTANGQRWRRRTELQL